MFRKRTLTMPTKIALLILSASSGCDDRATRIAREAANRQAQQNTAMADLNKEVAAGTQHLVAADAAARQNILEVHHDLQSERTRLDTGWSSLESERRQIAGERRFESILAPAISIGGGLLLLAVLLGFCWFAAREHPRERQQRRPPSGDPDSGVSRRRVSATQWRQSLSTLARPMAAEITRHFSRGRARVFH